MSSLLSVNCVERGNCLLVEFSVILVALANKFLEASILEFPPPLRSCRQDKGRKLWLFKLSYATAAVAVAPSVTPLRRNTNSEEVQFRCHLPFSRIMRKKENYFRANLLDPQVISDHDMLLSKLLVNSYFIALSIAPV
jgi:hypothetical protein